jgi:hypothetical protein
VAAAEGGPGKIRGLPTDLLVHSIDCSVDQGRPLVHAAGGHLNTASARTA